MRNKTLAFGKPRVESKKRKSTAKNGNEHPIKHEMFILPNGATLMGRYQKDKVVNNHPISLWFQFKEQEDYNEYLLLSNDERRKFRDEIRSIFDKNPDVFLGIFLG